MSKKLGGRLALITGASRGIGKATAHALAAEGADLILCARSKEGLKAIANDLSSYGISTTVQCTDMTDPHDVERSLEPTISRIGRLDILIHTVGGVETFGGFEDLSDEAWERSFQLNVLSSVRAIRISLPYLKKSRTARIISVASLVAHQPGFKNPHYSAAKAALANMSKHLATTLAEFNILVNTICPNTLTGERWEDNVSDRAERSHISSEEARLIMEQEELKKIPLRRIASPSDVASLIAFLCSDEASFITGECINIDGGTTRAVF